MNWTDPAEYAPPRPTLQQEPAAGNLGLLCFRVLESIAQPLCPQEWPLFRPFVEDAIQRKFKRQEG